MDIGTWLVIQAERIRGTRALFFGAVVVVLIGGALALVGTFAPVDLQVYRFGADAAFRGDALYGPLPPPASGVSLPFIYPPFAAVVFMVMTLPSLPVAAVLMDLVSVGALFAALYATVRRLWHPSPRTAAVMTTGLTAAALALEPVRSTLSFGQVNLVLMALVTVDCLAPNPRWPRGVLVGLAAAIKVTPAGFLLFFLLVKDFRASRNAVVTGAGATLLGFVVAPHASAEYFLRGGITEAAGLSGSPYATNQSIEGALNRLSLPPFAHGFLWVTLAAFVLVTAVVVLRRADGPIAFAVNAGVVLVLSPISWSHHWVWAAPALLILAARVRTRRGAGLVALGTAVFVVAPHSFLPSSNLRELAWAPWQHLVGDSYLVLALGLLTWQLFAAQPEPVTEPALESR